ncbi:hypothetical protein SCA03_39790 [Streptomyces cacaoi]|uniref:Uncharacterized protein n=1 Tax=Streptomyces cacaoi TaxID=1898 RepID=A0A4Y3R3X0_STRCI|nr:hypothetical protein SCA03_39790 [Streptomyces cacaoi]
MLAWAGMVVARVRWAAPAELVAGPAEVARPGEVARGAGERLRSGTVARSGRWPGVQVWGTAGKAAWARRAAVVGQRSQAGGAAGVQVGGCGRMQGRVAAGCRAGVRSGWGSEWVG